MSISTTVLMEACPHCGSEEFKHLDHDSCHERWIERGHSPDDPYDAMTECEHYECRKCGNEL